MAATPSRGLEAGTGLYGGGPARLAVAAPPGRWARLGLPPAYPGLCRGP